jgi:hypothetical protein
MLLCTRAMGKAYFVAEKRLRQCIFTAAAFCFGKETIP